MLSVSLYIYTLSSNHVLCVAAVYEWAPLIRSSLIQDQPLTMISSGTCPGTRAGIPVMLGNTDAEGETFIYAAANFPVPWYEFDAAAVILFHTKVLKVLPLYPHPSNADTRPALSRLTTDLLMQCPNRLVARSLSSSAVYAYVFNRTLPWPEAWGPKWSFCYEIPCHGAEFCEPIIHFPDSHARI